MKRILTYSAFLMFVAGGLASCKKDYTCYCYNEYRDVYNNSLRYTSDSRHTIESVKKEEAASECKYYQTHEFYLQYEVYVNHNCSVTEED